MSPFVVWSDAMNYKVHAYNTCKKQNKTLKQEASTATF